MGASCGVRRGVGDATASCLGVGRPEETLQSANSAVSHVPESLARIALPPRSDRRDRTGPAAADPCGAAGPVDEERDYGDVPCEGGGDFDSHDVGRVLQSPVARAGTRLVDCARATGCR